MRKTSIHLDLNALQHNVHTIRQHAPSQQIIAMVKANAYGHGLFPIAYALTGQVDALGVASLEEALALRHADLATDMVLMEGFFEASEINPIEQHDFITVIHHVAQIEMLERKPIKKRIRYWIKLDTGMHRLGFSPEQCRAAFSRLNAIAGMNFIGFMTHFSSADENHHAILDEQMALFKRVTSDLPGGRSLANSAAILTKPETHADVVRPGIMLYGISPFHDKIGSDLGLQPVMTRTAALLAMHDLQAGDCVGYHRTWKCPEPMRVGIVSIGYGDGYPRHIQENTPVMIRARQTQIIGRVSMDMLAVDLRPYSDIQLGEEVILWGPQLPVEVIARCANTSPYEIVTQTIQR